MAEKIRLVKSQSIRLTKLVKELQNVMCGMGWKPSKSGHSWDLDQSIVVLDNNGRYVKQISYKSPEKSNEFFYHGDDLTGGGGKNGNKNEDDEQIDTNFAQLDPSYGRLIVIMNIYDAYSKHQDLSMVKDAYIHLYDVNTQKELAEYSIENSSKFEGKTGMFVGEFYKENGEWEFAAIGEPARVRDISEMVEIIKRKYSSTATINQSWEEFLNSSQPAPKKGFLSRLFG